MSQAVVLLTNLLPSEIVDPMILIFMCGLCKLAATHEYVHREDGQTEKGYLCWGHTAEFAEEIGAAIP